jgi:2-dehydropantoate 2-reductase
MKIAVFGAGGVGGYFGGKLAQAGEEVTFIARGEHLVSIQTGGLKVDSIKGDFVVKPAHATDDPRRVGAVDVVLVAVKGWQVAEAARAMRPLVGSATLVVPLLNGVEAPDQLAEMLGRQAVGGGLCRISSFIAGTGHVRHVGIEPYVAFGELDGGESERCQLLLRAFERAEVKAEIPADIRIAMWDKFLFIAAFSGAGAVTRAPAGGMRAIPETRALLESAMQEIVAVAQAHHIGLPADSVAKTMAFIDEMQEGVQASMQRDILEGRPSELASQNGAVIRLGRLAGVPTPVNDFLYASLLPQELRARGEIGF